MQEILRATGRPRTDLARALGMDEANVRHYIRVSAEDSTLNRPVADPLNRSRNDHPPKDTSNGKQAGPDFNWKHFSVSAPDPNPIVQNSQLRRMAGTSSQTNSSSIGPGSSLCRTPCHRFSRIPVIIPVRKRMLSSPRTDQQQANRSCGRAKSASLDSCEYADIPTGRNSRRLTFELKAAVQTSAIPGSVTDFSDREESKIKTYGWIRGRAD